MGGTSAADPALDWGWHLDKKVTLGIISLLVVNVTTSIWWAATLTNEVQEIKGRPDLSERVIRLEAVTGEHTRYLARLDETLDRLSHLIERIHSEQNRRSPAIRYIEKQIDGNALHGANGHSR